MWLRHGYFKFTVWVKTVLKLELSIGTFSPTQLQCTPRTPRGRQTVIFLKVAKTTIRFEQYFQEDFSKLQSISILAIHSQRDFFIVSEN